MSDSNFKLFKPKEFGTDKPNPKLTNENDFKVLEYNRDGLFKNVENNEELNIEDKINISENFKSEKFNREDSLLTNAENYAQTIKDGAELYKKELISKIEINQKETELIKQETISLKKIAEIEKKKIISEANEEIKLIKKKAFEEGFLEGKEKGIQKRYDEAESNVKQIEKIINELKNLRKLILINNEKDIIKLALILAKKVMIAEIKSHPDLINSILKTSLKEIDSLGKIQIFLNPDDLNFLENSGLNLNDFLKEDQMLVLKKDPEIELGSLHIESEDEVIHFHLEKRYKELENCLMNELLLKQNQFKKNKEISENKDINKTSSSSK